MQFEYIIVQAGGLGSRMGSLTRNKPKALISVNNSPILFHLFEKYPGKRFIIIGDYKIDVLERYLETFAGVQYITLKSREHGNVAGIKQALDFIPSGSSFMLIWCDLILGENFSTEDLPVGNYIGVSRSFNCSWSFFQNKLEKKTIDGHGVAGVFLFSEKSELENIPEAGSFTRYIASQNLELREMEIADTIDIGSLEAFEKIESQSQNICRPYNRITFDGDFVIKESLTDDARKLLQFETDWYARISSVHDFGIPKIFSTNPLKMERIRGNNIISSEIADESKPIVIRKMVECLSALHKIDQQMPDPFDITKEYFQKTLARVRKIAPVIPFATDSEIFINERACKNPLLHLEKFQLLTEKSRKSARSFGIIHGDCTFSNTLIDSNLNIYFIDARGYFGSKRFIGDCDYDWAKMYYSIVGAFDKFNLGRFELFIENSGVTFSIEKSGWENHAEYFLSLIPDVNLRRIQFIHSIIWLSLASHCSDDFDSMCLAFYHGVALWNDVLEKILDEKLEGESRC